MSQVIENIDISQTLPVISFDYESLRQWALSITDKYKNLVVTEYDVKPIKKEMAELNKAKDKLNRARIDTVKAISAPIREFEEQIKDICGLFNDTYEGLARQVKDFENREREDKRKSVETLIYDAIKKAIADNPDLKDKIAISVKERWLNKTVTFNAIQEEIDAAIADQIRTEKERQRIEKAQAERRLLIENAVRAANEKYETDLPLYPFMEPYYTDLEKDASEILAIIEREAQDHSEMAKAVADRNLEKPNLPGNEAISVAPAHDISNVKINDIPLQPEPAKQDNLLMFRFTAIFTPDQEAQVKEILNRNNFLKIKRQLDSMGIHTIVEQGNAE